MAARHWLYFGGFVVTSLLLVVAGLLGVLDALSVLSGGTAAGGEFVLIAMVRTAIEWIVVGIVLGALALVFLVATVVSVLRSKSFSRSSRLASLAERAEREYPTLRRFDVSERVEPTDADRREHLKEQYVEGKLGDEEFEREMERLVDEDTTGGRRR